ncbi:putative membrane protein (TIGR04086 family) [Paenibacillus taihuensis]|uniref:Putative membrane protein (TIGR04086 family) n=1 Tax=Paenibacillus taihuensis TaxID=1156355 RepID=A0A3D9RWF5_9BACL|nr:TIGR04086 family membrane protein [Paenibacillus taihuensis]REE84329.1 putative membrane protein (TIGR04086 family) [Paenibacillus taihuensis]
MKPINAMKNVPKVHMASPMLSGILYSSIWLALGALLLSAMLRFGSMQETQLPMYSLIVHGCSSLAGGFVSGKRSGARGWYYGGLLGIAYGILILIVSFLASNTGISGRTLTMLLETLLCGALGGMIGVNAKRS